MATVNVKNVNPEKRNKAIFVLKAKGSTLSEEVRKMVDQLSAEYEKIK